MNVIEFLLELKELHIFVIQQADRITVKGDREALVPELKKRLADNKKQIIDTFSELGIQNNGQLAPTTFSQLRLWFIDQLEGSSVHYNMPSAIRLHGNINLNAIEKAHNKILERHESLRTCFVSRGDEPYQVIRDHKDIHVPICDLSHLSEAAQEKEVNRLCREESHKPFIIEQDIMMRWLVIKLSNEEHVLLRTLHHIASDGWSMGVLAKEFNALYRSFAEGKENPLPRLAIQYADYAHWQRQWLKGEVLESQLKHWTDQLSGIPSVHNLPLDRARPGVQTYTGNIHGCRINSEITDIFNNLCLQHGATLFMGLHAVFSILLSRYSGETDIVIGTPIANREQPDVAPLVGFFLNTLVFRCDLSEANDFIELLEQCKNTAWGAYAHQQVPFEQLVKVLNVEQSLSYSPIFQVMMILQNNDSATSDLPKVTTKSVNNGFNFAKFELTLNINQTDGELRLGWNYNTDLFDLSTIRRMATNFGILIRAIVASPQASLMSLPLLTEKEYKYCTSKWNNAKIPYQKDRCIHEIFEEQVMKTPQAIAVVTEDRLFSYKEMNEQANRLAHFLIDQGVASNTLVGVCMPRTTDMVVAVLAILKAGGAYVPIDSSYPQRRIDHICQEAKLRLVLTHTEVDLKVSSEISRYDLASQSLLQKLSKLSIDNPRRSDCQITSKDLAYVIYTSGSTGTPKGVMVSHQNLHAFYTAAKTTYQINDDDRMLQFSSFSFDIFVEEMFVTLLSGASLVFRNEKVMLGQNHFWNFITQQSVTVISLPTTFWHLLCGQLNGLPLSTGNLRLLIVGGESMSVTMLTRWRKSVENNVRLLNTYGPTETTVIATSFDLSELESEHSSIPIGKALPNTQCYVLNNEQQVCPVGVLGELCIGGDSVALGYLNRPILTQEKFIQNPFSDDPDNRLYRTGDKVRLLLDGNLEFIGRIDDQIKIRGFRIEPREIESQLSQYEAINSSHVIALENDESEKSLVAYVQPAHGNTLTDSDLITELRMGLQANLPDYLFPSAFVVIDEWPLTPHGKLDIKALPAPDSSLYQKEYVAPSTETEKILVDIWAKLLKLDVDAISVTANFFELGGHSLLAVRLVAEISSRFEQEISIKEIFGRADLKSLGLLLDSMTKQETVSDQLLSGSGDNIEEIEW